MARREHSFSELFRKLRKQGFENTDIETVLNTLANEGLQSNQRFVENYIHHRRKKGMGPLRIHAELLERGIAEELIEHQLQITDNVWLTEVHKVWQKRFKNRLPTDHKEQAAQMRFLHYRGFTSEQIETVFKQK